MASRQVHPTRVDAQDAIIINEPVVPDLPGNLLKNRSFSCLQSLVRASLTRQRTTQDIARNFILSPFSKSSLTLDIQGLPEDLDGLRLMYPFYDLFIYNRKHNIAGFIFGSRLSSAFFGCMIRKHGNMIFLFIAVLSLVYFNLALIGIVPSPVLVFIPITCLSIASLLAFILCFSTDILLKLCCRFEVQFSILNALGIVVGIGFIFENPMVMVAHSLFFSILCCLVIFHDACLKTTGRNVYLIHHLLAIFSLASLDISFGGSFKTDPGFDMQRHEFHINNWIYPTADPVFFSIQDAVSRCILNLILLCIAKIIILLRFPQNLVSLKGPMRSSKSNAALRQMVKTTPVFSNLQLLLGQYQGTDFEKVYIALNVKGSFEYRIDHTIGRVFLGNQFADRVTFQVLERIYLLGFLFLCLPCNVYLFARLFILSERDDPVNALDYFVIISMLIHGCSSLLYVNIKVLARVFHSLEIYILILPLIFTCGTLMYFSKGNHQIILPIMLLTLTLNLAVQDAHKDRFLFSIVTTLFSLFMMHILYFGIIFNLLTLGNASLFGLYSISLKELCIGWMTNTLIIIFRNFYYLILHPSCFLFIRTAMRAEIVPKDVARALKATSVDYLLKHKVELGV